MNTYFPYSYRVIAYSLCWVISVQPTMAKVQPGNANTQVIVAGNGVPVVNIARPNDKGLSHNQYQQFNVDKQGLILNNATDKLTQTQLGGLIQNNPNLNGKGASVILNEVTGANRSQLNGYTEVAGNKANVIVTNPYGITCSGCGFINTPRVTLSTGNPRITNGEVSGFNVNQGDIIIDGQGLDATKQDYLDIISRSAKIQANIHANQLNVIAGSNEVEYKTNHIRSTKQHTDNPPKVAIDSSALGGMYAGRIALVSTEHGVGVNVGNVATTTGGMTLTSEGKIVLGNISTAQGLVIKTSQEVALYDTQHAGTEVQITADSIQANQAYTAADNQVDLNANRIDVTNSQVVAGIDKNQHQVDGGQVMIKTQTLNATQGQIFASKDIEITATDSKFIASQMMANNDVMLAGESLDLDEDSQLVADNSIKINQTSLQHAGTISAKNTVAIDAQSLQQSGVTQANAMTITSDNAALSQEAVLSSQNDLEIKASQSLENAGVIAAQNALTIEANSAQFTDTSSLVAKGNIDVNVDNQLIQNGEVISQGDIHATANDIVLSDTASLAANGDIDVYAQNQLEQNGNIVSQGQVHVSASNAQFSSSSTLAAQGDIGVNVEQQLTQSGEIVSQGNMDVTANDATFSDTANLAALGDIGIHVEDNFELKGKMAAQGAIDLTANDMRFSDMSYLVALGDVGIHVQGLFNQAGAIASQSKIHISTNNAQFSASSSLVAQDDIRINVVQQLTQSGEIVSQGDMDVSANDITFSDTANLAALGNVTIDAQNQLEQHGSVAAQGQIASSSDSYTQSGQMVSGGDIQLTANQISLAEGGQLASQENLNLLAADALNQNGQLAANQDININTATLSQSGVIQANQNLNITAQQVTQSTTGVMQSGQDINLDSINLANHGMVYSGNNQQLTLQSQFSNMGQWLSQAALELNAQTIEQKGTLNANGDITLNANTLTILGNSQSSGNLSLTANQMNLQHDVLAGGNLDIDSIQSLSLNHRLQAGNNLNVTTQGQLINRGQLVANSQLLLQVLNIFNNLDSGVVSSYNLGISASNITNQGLMQAQGGLALDSQSNIDNQGTLVSMGDMHLQARNNLSNTALIYADNDAFLLANNTISNTDADILTGRDLVFSNVAGSKAKKWVNTSGNVESGRDLAIYADELLNKRKYIDFNSSKINTDIKDSTYIFEEQLVSVNVSYSGCVVGDRHNDNCGYYHYKPEIEKELLASTESSTLSFEGQASALKAAGNLYIQSSKLVNDASLIASNQDITISSQQVLNNSYQAGTRNYYNIYYAPNESKKGNESDDYTIMRRLDYVNQRTEEIKGAAIFSTIQAGDKLTITASGNVDNSQQGVHFTANGDKANMKNTGNESIATVKEKTSDVVAAPSIDDGSISELPSVNVPNSPEAELPSNQYIEYPLPKNDKGLFVFTPDVDSQYLIETNPALTNIDEFLGSDYLFAQMGYNPNKDIKVLGDAFYDTRFITQSIFEQTGQMYLSRSIGSDIEQMQSLLDKATREASDLHLQAGVALTPEQVASLTRDIVWWEPTDINGQTVLAPKLYLSQATLANVKSGSLIGEDEIAISASNINNSGSIDSSGNMTLVSQNAINNNGGLLQASNNLLLQAMNDINNIGAKIKGGDIALISEKGSINNLTESTVNRLSDNRGNLFVSTQFGNTASIEAANDLVLNTGKDINAHASNISAGGSAALQAQDSIHITAANDATTKKTQQLENYHNTTVSASINAGEQLMMNAGKDINIHASQISAGGSAALQAGDNINITSANDATQIKGHNMEKRHVEMVSSTVNAGEHLALESGKDITVIGSQLTAGGDAALKAKGDITLQAQTNSDYSYLKTKKKKSFGRSKTTITETQTESTVGADITSGGNLTLQAQKLGNTQLAGGSSSINVIGSELKSGGDVRLSADGDITLAAHETQTYDHKEVYKSGLGGLSKKQKGSIDYATQLTGSDVEGAGTVLINSGNDINLIASGVEASKDASLTAMNQVLVGAGQTTENHQSWSKSSSFLSGGSLFTMETIKDTSTDIKAQGSNISAQGNVSVQSGNAKVIGSDINAQGNILLVADTGDMQILAAEESHSNSHKSEKLDVGFGDMFKNLTPQGMIDSAKESTKSGQAKATIADATYDAVDSSIERTTHQGANIIAGGDVTVNADNDINITGSNLIAGNSDNNSDDTSLTSNGDISLNAVNNITIAEVNNTENTKTKETHGEASVSVKVQHQAVEVAKMVKATEDARKQAEKAQKDYKQYKKQLDSLESTLDDLQTQLANHESGVTKQDVLELQNIIEDTKSDEAWYLSNIALSGANLASKITLLAKQTAAAAQSSGTYGFDVGLEANVSASTSKNETISSTAQGSTLAGNNININASQDATIQGSQVLAQDTLNLSADNVNILASKDTHSAQSSSESGSITVSTSLYEASTGLGVDVNLSKNAATSNSTHYNNSMLAGDNVNITTSNDTTIKGGNVIANNGLNVDVGGNLTVESLQNRDTASNHGMSISAGLGSKESNLSVGSAGFNQSQGRSSQTDTVISSLVSNGDANINVKGNTELTGSTIATLDENGNDSGKLALNTGSLTFTDLSDTSYSSHNNNGLNTSVGINATGIDATNNSSTLNLDNGSHYSKDKTLATLGNGDIQIGDGTVLAPELNRDIHNQDKELFAVDRQQGNVDVTLDHRLLTEEGRQSIKEDFKRNDIVIDSIVDATKDDSGVSFISNDEDKTRDIWETQANKQEFFTATKNFVANPENAQYVQTLNDPNASLEQKQQAQQVLVNNIAAQMKVDPAVVLQAMTTDEQNSSTKGGYINGGNTLYVNGDMHDTIQDEANTVGHEMQHYLDHKAGTTASNDNAKQNLEYFADTMGNATEDFLDFNYGNLTDTTFGGSINHTASTNAPGSGMLLDTNTKQFNQAKEHGELENRMPPNAFGVDWSNMDSGGIQVQANIAEIVKQADKELKEEMVEATKTYGPLAAGTACTVMSMGVCAEAMTAAGAAIDVVDYFNRESDDILNPKAGKIVLDATLFKVSQDIKNIPFVGQKVKIAGQVGTGLFGFMANGWADKAAEYEVEVKHESR
ncbi:hemagglutinin repeat-containing protein [Vibrio fluvialis]|nr:hemagglutinin repeat-containing protein [Vibrio fluvialis]